MSPPLCFLTFESDYVPFDLRFLQGTPFGFSDVLAFQLSSPVCRPLELLILEFLSF